MERLFSLDTRIQAIHAVHVEYGIFLSKLAGWDWGSRWVHKRTAEEGHAFALSRSLYIAQITAGTACHHDGAHFIRITTSHALLVFFLGDAALIFHHWDLWSANFKFIMIPFRKGVKRITKILSRIIYITQCLMQKCTESWRDSGKRTR